MSGGDGPKSKDAVSDITGICYLHHRKRYPMRDTFFRVIYSHSTVPGGLLVISYTTRLTRSTSLMMRLDTLPRIS